MLSSIINKSYPVSSNFSTLSQIVENKSLFNIPLYQRLYVWGNDQIKTLLDDLDKGFKENIPRYYLGGVTISRNQDELLDLIDGQQRFTTLWLIGAVLKHSMTEFNYLESSKSRKARLSFSIREFANEFFNDTSSITKLKNIGDNNISELKPIVSAIRTINRFFEDKEYSEKSRKRFADFIMNRVLLMVTEMPKNTDENKLFEVSNNRGVQLQQHEILKAKFIRCIDKAEDKTRYAQLWDACSIMNEYIEKNIKDVSGLNWGILTFQPDDNEKEVGLPINILKRLKSSEGSFDKHLLAILESNENISLPSSSGGNDNLGYDSGKVRSIISFPMLLLHVLRVFQLDRKVNLDNEEIAAVDEKKLLAIFDKHFHEHLNEVDVRFFIELLWEIRVKFDKHVIKWIEKGPNLEIHSIKKLYLNKETLQRREVEKNDGFSLLQSMLYHSQPIITHYWLTPLFNKLRSCDNADELYLYLRKVDNAMFCSGNNEDARIKSWKLMQQDMDEVKPSVTHFEINAHKGTAYSSYTFYKLEFILWFLRDRIYEVKQLVHTKRDDWENYRITAKNSVEHISPQKKREDDLNLVWDKHDTEESKRKKLDDFGNLVLLTSSMNLEYQNKIYTVKRSEFLAKANNRRLDSLKSALIFENSEWNWDLCKSHRNDVVSYIEEYFKK